MDHGQFEHTEVIDSEFFIPNGHAAIFLEPADATLDYVSLAIGLAVEFQRAPLMVAALVRALGDDRFDVSLAEEAAYCGITVAFISSQAPWAAARPPSWLGYSHRPNNFLEAGGFMALTRGYFYNQRQALSIDQ